MALDGFEDIQTLDLNFPNGLAHDSVSWRYFVATSRYTSAVAKCSLAAFKATSTSVKMDLRSGDTRDWTRPKQDRIFGFSELYQFYSMLHCGLYGFASHVQSGGSPHSIPHGRHEHDPPSQDQPCGGRACLLLDECITTDPFKTFHGHQSLHRAKLHQAS